MGVRTRSSVSNSPVKSKPSTKVILPSTDGEPYKIFVLPCDTSEDARFVLLKNPRDGARRRYYFCPSKGIFETTKVSGGGHDPRSILFASNTAATNLEARERLDKPDMTNRESDYAAMVKITDLKEGPSEGYVNKSAEVFVATPFDPVFILLPLLGSSTSPSRAQAGEGHFRPFDDILDEQVGDDRHLRYVLTHPKFQSQLLKATNYVCDSVQAGDEQMYRLNLLKLNDYILAKARRVVENGLPASLEGRFVTRSLEVPVQGVKREKITVSLADTKNDVTSLCHTPDASDSQSSVASTVPTAAFSEASSATSIATIDHTSPTDLIHLQRLRTAISFITASYLDPKLSRKIAETPGDSKSSPDFGTLDEHLQHLAQIRAEAHSIRSVSDFSKKRNLEDDDAAEERAEKKRKQEEEEKRKKSQESRGVRDLKKVNVSGMKKMSAFFAKKAPTAKSKS